MLVINFLIGQLLCGPLLDRFGRKRPLVIGLILYILASIGCAVSTSIETLIAFRLLQALASAMVGLLGPQTAIPMAVVMAVCTSFGLMILFIGRRKNLYKVKKQDIEEQALDMIEKY